MSALKDLGALTDADVRNTYWVVDSPGKPQRSYGLEDLYADVAAVQLDPAVPEHIREHFAQAQNLAVFAWYYYPFHITARFMGMVSVEFALRERSGHDGWGLKRLLQLAVAEGWIKDEGFLVAQRRPAEGRPYVEILVETMPKIRNEDAHGSTDLDDGSALSLRICADLINQLFGATANYALERPHER